MTIDYGPFGFLDAYQPGFICNHSDHQGRYAYNRQPNIALWNLACLAQAMLPLVDQETLKAALDDYAGIYNNTYLSLMQHKLGMRESRADDAELIGDLLTLMAQSNVDYTNTMRRLSEFRTDIGNEKKNNTKIRDCFIDRDAFDAWATRYSAHLESEQSIDREREKRMKQVNPKYILRNYLAQLAIEKAQQKDFSEIERLQTLLATPFDEHPEQQSYAAEPPDWAKHIEVSCSS